MAKNNKPVTAGTIEEIARRGCFAVRSQCALSPTNSSDDEAWNNLAAVSRAALRDLARKPSRTSERIRVKAEPLALVTEREGERDYRFALAQSLLGDLTRIAQVKK
jgi:hypothetical protein